MPQISKISKAPPAAVETALIQLGKNIRTARLRRRWKQESLAHRVGVSRYVIADIKRVNLQPP